MKSKLLLPHRFKTIGILLLIPMLALGIAGQFFAFNFDFLSISHTPGFTDIEFQQNLTDEVTLTGIVLGLLFIAFAREKQEDEFISKLRLESLQWSVIINYILLLIATWTIYGTYYLNVMIWNILTILAIFVVRFHIVLYKNKTITD